MIIYTLAGKLIDNQRIRINKQHDLIIQTDTLMKGYLISVHWYDDRRSKTLDNY